MQSEYKYGFLGGGVIAISFYADEVYGAEIPSVPWMVNIIVFGVIGWAIYLALKEKREANRKEFVFAKAILTGLITCFCMASVAGVYSFSYAKFVNPDKAKQEIAKFEPQWEKQNVPPDKIEEKKKAQELERKLKLKMDLEKKLLEEFKLKEEAEVSKCN